MDFDLGAILEAATQTTGDLIQLGATIYTVNHGQTPVNPNGNGTPTVVVSPPKTEEKPQGLSTTVIVMILIVFFLILAIAAIVFMNNRKAK